jgi:hypothetical protein
VHFRFLASIEVGEAQLGTGVWATIDIAVSGLAARGGAAGRDGSQVRSGFTG